MRPSALRLETARKRKFLRRLGLTILSPRLPGTPLGPGVSGARLWRPRYMKQGRARSYLNPSTFGTPSYSNHGTRELQNACR